MFVSFLPLIPFPSALLYYGKPLRMSALTPLTGVWVPKDITIPKNKLICLGLDHNSRSSAVPRESERHNLSFGHTPMGHSTDGTQWKTPCTELINISLNNPFFCFCRSVGLGIYLCFCLFCSFLKVSIAVFLQCLISSSPLSRYVAVSLILSLCPCLAR